MHGFCIKKEAFMNIIEYALQTERDGEAFYRELAECAPNKGIRTIMNLLANEEAKHYRIVQALKSEFPAVPPIPNLSRIKNVFKRIKQRRDNLNGLALQSDLYRNALILEKRMEAIYIKETKKASTPVQKTLLLRLAEEERKHSAFFEELLEFISRPETWLENAEIHQVSEY
jgi:rubrerythrin